MSRKQVAVHTHEGQYSHHITHREAFQLVRDEQKAEWNSNTFKAITMLDPRITPRGERVTFFEDVWEKRDSAGIMVWQMRTRHEEATT